MLKWFDYKIGQEVNYSGAAFEFGVIMVIY